MANPSYAIVGLALLTAFCTVGWITSGNLPSEEHTVEDLNTNSNFLNTTAFRYHLNVTVDFDKKMIIGDVSIYFYGLRNRKVATNFVDLDIKDLNIIKIQDSYSKTLYYEIQGEKLHVEFPELQNEELPVYQIIITYSTTEYNKAIQWIDAKDTESKKAPFMYFVAYPNHARSLFPCFDTPGFHEMWFSSSIRIPKGVMSYTTGATRYEDSTYVHLFGYSTVWTENYLCHIHTLFLVVGALQERRLLYTTLIAEQPSDKHDSQMRRALRFVDWVCYFYQNSQYRYVIEKDDGLYAQYIIMPKSFPFNVLASAGLLLVHPSMLTDEQSITHDLISKLTDRWNGQSTGLTNWDHPWVTEAFSKFVVREAYAQMFGEEIAILDARIGYLRMNREVKRLGDEYSSLQPNTSFKYPLDVAIPVIQSEKGYHLILSFLKLLKKSSSSDVFRSWEDFTRTSRPHDTNDVVRHFGSVIRKEFGFFDSLPILHDFRMDLLTKETGVPESQVNFSIPILDEINQIVSEYISAQGASSPENFASLKAYSKKAQLAFFEELLFRAEEFTFELVARLATDYSEIVDGDYDEIKSAWFQLCALKDYMRVSSKLSDFLSSTGVTDHIRPIYRALRDNGRLLYAKNVLEMNFDFYHPFVYSLIANDLSQ